MAKRKSKYDAIVYNWFEARANQDGFGDGDGVRAGFDLGIPPRSVQSTLNRLEKKNLLVMIHRGRFALVGVVRRNEKEEQ